MATKRQRRRRAKERRHDYEFVYVDPAGQPVDVEEPEEKERPERKPTSGQKPVPAGKQGAKTGTAGGKTPARNEREVPPPSWERTLRRAAIFVPIMLLFLYFTRPKSANTGGIVLQAAFIIVLLI